MITYSYIDMFMVIIIIIDVIILAIMECSCYL